MEKEKEKEKAKSEKTDKDKDKDYNRMDTKQSYEQLKVEENNQRCKKGVSFNNLNKNTYNDSVFVDEPVFSTGHFKDADLNNSLINTKNSNISKNTNTNNKN